MIIHTIKGLWYNKYLGEQNPALPFPRAEGIPLGKARIRFFDYSAGRCSVNYGTRALLS
jgi:hypothetical protein